MIDQGLQKRKLELLQLKLELMREWTALFFDSPHRSVMTLLCSMRMKGVQKFDMNTQGHYFKQIRDIQDIINQLQEGKLVLIQEWRPTKKDKKTNLVQLDFNFFKIIQSLIKMVMENIKPRLEDFKQIQQGQKRKICKNCKTERTQTEIVYLGLKCRCTNTNFITVEPDFKQHKRLSDIQSALETRFLLKKKRIDQMERKLTHDYYKERKNEENKSTKLYEEFCQRQKLPAMRPQNLIRSGNIERMRALHLYGRRQSFNSVNQLKCLNQLRIKHKEKLQNYAQSMGTND